MSITNLSFSSPDVAIVIELQNPSGVFASNKPDVNTSILTSRVVSSNTYTTLGAALTAAQGIDPNFSGLALYDAPVISEVNVDDRNLDFVVGNPATINCEVSASSGTITYQWSKDGTDIPNAEDSSLSTTSFNANQVGTYTCDVLATDTATATVANEVYRFEVTETVAPVVFNSTTAFGIAAVDSLTVNNAGTGYTANATNVTTTGGSGTGLTIDITTDGDAITAATVNFPGEDYVDGETVTVSGDGNGDATLDITVN